MAVMNTSVVSWHVQEGAMVAPSLHPDTICEKLRSYNVVAELDWYPQTPHLIGVNVLVNKSGGVAALDDVHADYRVGITAQELTRRLAEDFNADVTIGECHVNKVKEGLDFPSISHDKDEVVRVCEISALPEASVPFCAAAEDKDMGCIEIAPGIRAVFYETTRGAVRDGVMATMEAPCIALYSKAHDYSMAAIAHNDVQGSYPEALLIHSWMLHTRMIPGSIKEENKELEARIRDDLGHGHVAERTAQLFDFIDAQALLCATRTHGREGFMQAVKALGLPSEMVSFLFGHVCAKAVTGARYYSARGWSEAFGQSVDIKLTEPEPAGSLFWRLYRKSTIDKPWIARGIAIGEAIGGTVLATAALREKPPRSGWAKLGGIMGGIIVFDAIVEVLLAQYLSGRAKKHRQTHFPRNDS